MLYTTITIKIKELYNPQIQQLNFCSQEMLTRICRMTVLSERLEINCISAVA